MTTLDGAPPTELLGRQTPTHELLCPQVRTLAQPAIDLAADCGVHLDPWQQYGLRHGMGINAEDIWAAYEVVDIVSRRNGKTVKLYARALAGLFLLGEVNILWTAHRYDTVMVSFRVLENLIKGNPDLRGELLPKRNEGISTTHGQESITLRTGAVINFRTRGPDTGRGFDGDLLIVDEAQDATPEQMAAISGALTSAADPQIWYSASAGHPKSQVLGDLVHRALATPVGDPARDRLYFGMWSAEEDDDIADPQVWAKTNPSYGIRLRPATIAAKYAENRYRPEFFAQEHLGVGNYPKPESESWIIPSVDWTRREDQDGVTVGNVVLAAHAAPDQSWASIALAGWRSDGSVQVQLVSHDRGTRWVPAALIEMQESFDTLPQVVLTAKGPLGYLVPDMEVLGLDLRLLSTEERVEATSWLIQAGTEKPPEGDDDTWSPRLWHTGQAPLTVALAEANLRRSGESQVLSNVAPIDVSPIHAAMYAGYGLQLLGRAPGPPPAPLPVPAGDRAGGSSTADLSTTQF